MFELLIAFSFWPWVLVLSFFAICGLSTKGENTVVAIAGLIIYAGLAWYLFDAQPLYWLINNPLLTFAIMVMYCAIGGLWSLLKWRWHMCDPALQKDLLKAKAIFVEQYPEKNPSEYRHSLYFPNQASPAKCKEAIISWIMLWPFSMFLYVFDDLLWKLFNAIYERFSGVYQRIADSYLP